MQKCKQLESYDDVNFYMKCAHPISCAIRYCCDMKCGCRLMACRTSGGAEYIFKVHNGVESDNMEFLEGMQVGHVRSWAEPSHPGGGEHTNSSTTYMLTQFSCATEHRGGCARLVSQMTTWQALLLHLRAHGIVAPFPVNAAGGGWAVPIELSLRSGKVFW